MLSRASAKKNSSSMGKAPVTRVQAPKRIKNNKLISQYHATINEQKSHESSDLDKLGGFEAYQNASLYGTKHGDTSKWLLKELKSLVKGRKFSAERKMKLLDVGALAHNYLDAKWIKTDAIDLHPRLPGIKREDYLQFEPKEKKDVVCLSLVLNFVGDPFDRGEMIRRAHDHLAADGFLFVVLPRACVNHSRFMTLDHFTSLCASAGFQMKSHHLSMKLAYFLMSKSTPNTVSLLTEPNLTAAGFNNFKIRLKK